MQRLFNIVLVLVLLSLPLSGAHAANDSVLAITNVDTEHFPWIALDVMGIPPGFPVNQVQVQIGGKPVAIESTATVYQPLSVAFVADTSPIMAQPQAQFSSSFVMMRQRLIDMLMHLQSVEPIGEQRASLISAGKEMAVLHPLSNDFGALMNTVQGSDPNRPFTPPSAGDNAEPKVLGAAITVAMQELLTVQGPSPRVLVVLASAASNDIIDVSSLVQPLAVERQTGRPISVLVIGYSNALSDAAASTSTSSLVQLANSLGGELVMVEGSPSPEVYVQINTAFNAILQRGVSHRFLVHAPSLPGTLTTIQVGAGNATAEARLELPPTLSPFHVQVAGPIENKLHLSVVQDDEGAPPSQVQYLLDWRVLDEPLSNAPAFEYAIDLSDPAFQARFAPGSYSLTAVAWDAEGKPLASNQPLQIVVMHPSSSTSLLQYWWVLAVPLVLAVAGVGVWQFLKRRHYPYPSSSAYSNWTTTTPAVGDEDVTRRMDDEEPTARISQPVSDEVTRRLDGTAPAQPRVRWFVDVLENDRLSSVELPEHTRYYDLGRRTSSGHQPCVALTNLSVSRDMHATLTPTGDGMTLLAAETTNGTYVGEDRQPLSPNVPHVLQSQDVFWLGHVKLRLRCEVENSA